MTRYYFDIRDNTGLYRDEEGLEFETVQEAQAEAAEALASLTRDVAPTSERHDVAVEVRTGGKHLFQVALIISGGKTTQ